MWGGGGGGADRSNQLQIPCTPPPSPGLILEGKSGTIPDLYSVLGDCATQWSKESFLDIDL